MLHTQSVTSLDATPCDITNFSDIYSPHLTGVRSNTLRGSPENMNTDWVEKVPRVLPRHESVTLAADSSILE